ncbi:MAG: SDR family NAD(P)-dependent oxidoreductase [Phenylobacterium sp.]
MIKGRTIAVFGATGGLGAALVVELTRRGAAVVAVTRRPAATVLDTSLAGQVTIDLESPESIEKGVAALPRLDAAVFLTGIDVRKPLSEHSADEIGRTLRINLEGPILATRRLIDRVRNGGVIAHVGGFADGRLALPYYTADVASRAGLAAFSEALTRELKLEGRDIVVSYLCPEPAATEAERPYLDLWRTMGTSVSAPSEVARFIADSLEARPGLRMMGRTSRLIAWINALSPGAADVVALNRIGRKLREAFGRPAGRPPAGD